MKFLKNIIKGILSIPYILFVLLVVAPCKAIYEGWQQSMFEKYVLKGIRHAAIKDSGKEGAEGH